MHSGFRGSRLGISEVILREGHIVYEVQYIDEDGVVHGTMRHTHPYDNESELGAKADELITTLLDMAAKMHFASPSGRPSALTGGVSGGIAEALGAAAPTSDEPDGAPG